MALRVLMTNITLAGRTGTETVTRDVALGLLQAGHAPNVYTRRPGPISEHLIAKGVPVVSEIAALEGPFDVIHGNHLVGCLAVLARFPETPALSICHDATTWFDTPLLLPNITRYAAVSEVLINRTLLETGVRRERVDLILNGVDMDRFARGQRAREAPKTALAFAKNEEHVEVIRALCAERRIKVEFIGSAVGNVVEDPERLLPRFDLVFASDLSALESMACLRPVLVCDGRGLAGMVDMARYEAWRPHNFAARILTQPLTLELLRAELDRYDPAEAFRVGRRAREEAAVPAWIAAYVAAYEKAIADFQPPNAHDHARAWAHCLETWGPRQSAEWQWAAERQAMQRALTKLAAGLEPAPRGERLGFSASARHREIVELFGFDGGDANSVWSTQGFAGWRFNPVDVKSDLGIDIEYGVYLPDAAFELEITALLNGAPIDAWRESGEAGWRFAKRMITAPKAECAGAAAWLTLKMTQIAGPPPQHLPALALRAATFTDIAP